MQLVLKALLSTLGSWALRLASEEFVEWALLWAAEQAVKSTKTTKDDEWFNKIKETIQERPANEE